MNMTFISIYSQALLLVVVLMTALWLVSILLKNVSIVDLFWGLLVILGGSSLPGEKVW
jgi:steroid 5-alpha reductase family enzyme